MPHDQLTHALAAALDVDPAAILRCHETAGGRYTVLLATFQKFTRVRPDFSRTAPPPGDAPAQPAHHAPAPLPVPDRLRAAWAEPAKASKSDLVALCEHFNLDPEGTKRRLLARLDALRDDAQIETQAMSTARNLEE